MEDIEKDDKKTSYKGLIAIIIILVLAIAGVVVYFVCFDTKENKYSTNSNTSKTTTKVYYTENKDVSIEISNNNVLTTNITIDGETKKVEKLASLYDTKLYTIYYIQVLPITNTNNGNYYYVVDKNTNMITMTSLNKEEAIYPIQIGETYFLVGEIDSFHPANIYSMDKKLLGYSKLCSIFNNTDGKCNWNNELNRDENDNIYINDSVNLNGRIVQIDSKGNKLNVFTPKAYRSSDNKYSVTTLTDNLCVIGFGEYGNNGTFKFKSSKSGNYTTMDIEDGSQGNTVVIIENGKIVAISGSDWYNIYNIGPMEGSHLYIENTVAGTFVKVDAYIGDMNASASIYSKNGKYLGEYYKNIIADAQDVYAYDAVDIYNLEESLINKNVDYFNDDTEYVKELEKLTLTKYDINGNVLGKYKCINNICELIEE